jgi:hypothetical protein
MYTISVSSRGPTTEVPTTETAGRCLLAWILKTHS